MALLPFCTTSKFLFSEDGNVLDLGETRGSGVLLTGSFPGVLTLDLEEGMLKANSLL